MPKIYCVLGPTAVGKTELSIQLAKHLGTAEIINTDASAFYKGMDIGTAKITEEEMEHIPHHFLSFLEPEDDSYSILKFQHEARACINELHSKGKDVIIVGGSVLYVKALLFIYEFETRQPEEEKQFEQRKKTLLSWSKEQRYEHLCALDSQTTIHPNNEQRVINAILRKEFNEANEQKGDQLYYPEDMLHFIGLTCDREQLYHRINKRVEHMIYKGLLNEVTHFNAAYRSQQAIGYKEVHDYFSGNVSFEEMVGTIQKNTRHLAKRQLTWYRNSFNHILWLNRDELTLEQCLEKIYGDEKNG